MEILILTHNCQQIW